MAAVSSVDKHMLVQICSPAARGCSQRLYPSALMLHYCLTAAPAAAAWWTPAVAPAMEATVLMCLRHLHHGPSVSHPACSCMYWIKGVQLSSLTLCVTRVAPLPLACCHAASQPGASFCASSVEPPEEGRLVRRLLLPASSFSRGRYMVCSPCNEVSEKEPSLVALSRCWRLPAVWLVRWQCYPPAAACRLSLHMHVQT
jgi:hypothetical protein